MEKKALPVVLVNMPNKLPTVDMSKVMEMEIITPDSTSCCSSRRLVDIRKFVAVFSVYIMIFTMMEMYLVAVITTIEKKFGFASSQAGMILSIKELAYILTVSIATHAAKHRHRPRVMGLMGMLASCGGFFFLLPHLVYGTEMFYARNKTTAEVAREVELCLADDKNMSHDVAADDVVTCSTGEPRSGFNMGAFVLFSVGAVCIGLAMTVNSALSTTYIADATNESDNAFYLGIIHGMWPLGPMVGFLMGGLFTTLPEYLTDPGYDATDPRWVGAWWLGYVICPVLILLPACILPMFPSTIKCPHKVIGQDRPVSNTTEDFTLVGDWTKNKARHKEIKIKISGRSTRKGRLYNGSVVGFAASLFRLLTTPEYMLLVTATCFLGFLISGMYPFLPKYMELHFYLSAALANVLTGAVATSMAAFGAFLGGLIVSRTAWRTHQTAVFLLIANLLVALTLFLCMAVTCPQQPISDLNTFQHVQSNSSVCHRNCPCSETLLSPVCSQDGHMFRSPCHAGCTHSFPNQTYTQCACVGDSGGVTSAHCKLNCSNVFFFLILVSLAALIGMMAKVPAITVLMQCVDSNDRSLAMGFLGAVVGLVCFVPGPVAYGAVIDSTCIHWQYHCGVRGACALYDLTGFRLKLFGATAGFQLFAAVFTGGAAVLIWRKRNRKPPSEGQTTPEINAFIDTDNCHETGVTDDTTKVSSM